MKVKNLLSIMGLLLIIILISYFSDYSKSLENNWNITLPKGYKELFAVDSGTSFLGDGQRYHVYSYKEELKRRELEKFSLEKNINIEKEVEKILSSLQVLNERKLNFSKKYYWYRKKGDNDIRDKLYLIYFNEDKVLHVIEEFY